MSFNSTALQQRLLDRFERLVRQPTAPFREQWVAAELDRQLAAIPGLDVTLDRFGNRIARLGGAGHDEPPHVCFVAHLDHPGFVFFDPVDSRAGNGNGGSTRQVVATFEGNVDDAFFPGAAVRLFRSADDPGIPGRVVSATRMEPPSDNRKVTIEVDGDPTGAVLAMWDVPVFSVSDDGFANARVCDDLMGVAGIVEALARLAESGAEVNAAAVFTRAEEAGFCGLLCLLEDAAEHGWLSPQTLCVSIESPGETMAARCGDGAIIRVGDRSTTFDAAIADELWAHAAATGAKARRALMDRGTCEATPLARAGFRAGGLCAPVRNYHNMDREAGRIAPERVAVGDMEALASLIAELSMGSASDTRPAPAVRLNYDLFLRKGLQRLAESPAPVAVLSPT